MFNFGSATPSNNSLFTSSTPVNQNRAGNNFLFGNTTTTQPSTLTSTPFPSSSIFGSSTPSTTVLQPGTMTGTGTIHKFDAIVGTDKMNKGGVQTQIRTKLFNICAMPVYEKKSTEELRLEDYTDNRKFPSTTSGLFSTSSTMPMFGGTTTNPATTSASTNIFGGSSSTTSTLGSNFFGNRPATSTTTTPAFSAFGAPTATTAAGTPFAFGGAPPMTSTTPFGTAAPVAAAPAASTSLFAFGSTPASLSSTTTAPTFSFGGSSTLFPPAAATTTTATPFNFALPKSTASPFSFNPNTSTISTAAPSTFNIFPTTTTAVTAAPNLFSMNPTNTSMFAPAPTTNTGMAIVQSAVDTRTHLQLFQTMLNVQPFNSELGFLARTIKPNLGLDRSRLRTAPDPPSVRSMNNVFSPLAKPSVPSSSSTSTNPNSLAVHSNTLPSLLLPSAMTSSASSSLVGLFGKRKLADSFLDDDDDNTLAMDDGPSAFLTTRGKIPNGYGTVTKRPRVLDMNKVRSVVLGGVETNSFQPAISSNNENHYETFVVKPTSETSDVSGWKKFPTYDAYIASKKPQIELVSQRQIELLEEDQKKEEEEEKLRRRAYRLPILTHDDYYTKPTIDELRSRFNGKGQCFVEEFTVGREHYGSVTFEGSHINVAGLDLNRLVEIGRRQVTVYPDENDKPTEGQELNCQATIALLGVYPIDRSVPTGGEEVTDPDRLIDMAYGDYLQGMTRKFDGQFLDYDVYTGTWTFRVQHF